MALIRPSTLLLGTAMAGPTLYRYFITEDLDFTTTLTRFLIAVAVAAVMLSGLRTLTSGYGGRPALNLAPRRRRTDPPPEEA